MAGGEICGKGEKILIIDDDPSVRDFLERFLRMKGCVDIQVVGTAQEGLLVVGGEPVKIVFLDVMLPDGNGLEVLRQIKQIRPSVWVIMITGFPEQSIAKQAMAEGAYDYIIKPFDLAYLELSVLTKIATLP
jgi:DNA-binding NtrC family response regulator